jgi:hypothetical protein
LQVLPQGTPGDSPRSSEADGRAAAVQCARLEREGGVRPCACGPQRPPKPGCPIGQAALSRMQTRPSPPSPAPAQHHRQLRPTTGACSTAACADACAHQERSWRISSCSQQLSRSNTEAAHLQQNLHLLCRPGPTTACLSAVARRCSGATKLIAVLRANAGRAPCNRSHCRRLLLPGRPRLHQALRGSTPQPAPHFVQPAPEGCHCWKADCCACCSGGLSAPTGRVSGGGWCPCMIASCGSACSGSRC